MKRHILNHPLFKWMLGPVETQVKIIGFQQTAQAIMKRSSAKIYTLNKTSELQQILRDKPVVVVANHPTSPAVLALIATLQDRPDFRLIISSKFVGNSPVLDLYLLPAYIQHHFTSKRNPLLDAIFGKYIHGLTPEQEHVKNRETISNAAKHLADGGIVVLFPGYPERDGGNWYRGVGHLLTESKRNDAVIVAAHIQEHAWIEYVRLFPGIGHILPPISITFATPLYMRDVIVLDPKTLTKRIETHYQTLIATK